MITDLRLLVLALSLSLPLFRLYTRLPTLLSFIYYLPYTLYTCNSTKASSNTLYIQE